VENAGAAGGAGLASGAPGVREARNRAERISCGVTGGVRIVIPKGIAHLAKRIPEIWRTVRMGCQATHGKLFAGLLEHLQELDNGWRSREADRCCGIVLTSRAATSRKFMACGPHGERPGGEYRRCESFKNARQRLPGWGWYRDNIPRVARIGCWHQ